MNINLKNAISHFYPNPSFEQIYFESVANAIDAGASSIDISISITEFTKPKTLFISVKDNGDGFNDKNFGKFTSLLETDEEHKGLGRLVYLAYFNDVEIDSYYGTRNRCFTFNSSFDGESTVKEIDETLKGSILNFKNFSGAKIKSYEYLKPEFIKDFLIEHFFPLLFEKRQNNENFAITIELNLEKANPKQDFFPDKVILTPADIPDLKSVNFKNEELDLYHDFKILYSIKNNPEKNKSLITALCIDGRTIRYPLTAIDSIPNCYQAVFLFDSGFFKGKGKINSSRQIFSLPDNIPEKNFKFILRREIAQIIDDEIPSVKEDNSKINKELDNAYPHLTGFFSEDNVGLIVKNEAIENAQTRFFNEQKKILECTELDDKQYPKAIEQASRVLLEYILYRTRIIQKLKSMNPNNSEPEIHKLLVPMQKTLKRESFDQDVYNNNIWMLDDKYMSYSTILSDEKMSKVIREISLDEIEDDKRPDITLVFSNDPQSANKVDVVIVELKKHGLPLAKNEEVISQLRQRARKLLKYYPNNIERIWFYGITDIDQEFRVSLKEDGFKELFSHGSMFYKSQPIIVDDENNPFPIDLYVMTYDTFINDAESRNSTFLRILKNSIEKNKDKNFD
jgi:hypothetical protein